MDRKQLICPRIVGLQLALALALIAGTEFAQAGTRELIKNGKFEKGLSKWRLDSSNRFAARFFPDEVGSTSPHNRLMTSKNPQGGKKYAIADQLGPSFIIMRQKFRIPRGARSVILKFQMFADSLDPVVVPGKAFNLNKPNQHARVDLLKGNAKAKEDKRGVVRQLYTKGADAVEAPNPPRYRRHRINLSRDVTPGRSYQLRFSVTATEDQFLLGVDNVSIKTR